jgi:5-methylcytosine-specific restriction endonuclease McrA
MEQNKQYSQRSVKSFLSLHVIEANQYQEFVPLVSHIVKQKRKVNGTMKKIVASEQKWRCKRCSCLLTACYEVDHVIRLEIGGTNDRTNLVALCRECHGMKTSYERI